MPTWVSDGVGLWHPAKERVPLKNLSGKPLQIEQTSDDGKKFTTTVMPGQDYIYEGPDRAAMFQWWTENGRPSAEQMQEMMGQVTMGEDFRKNSEFMEQYAKFRQMFGFKDVKAYLEYLGYDPVKAQERFEKNASQVNTHELPQRIAEIKRLGGGDDKANPGKNERYGDFGDMPTV